MKRDHQTVQLIPTLLALFALAAISAAPAFAQGNAGPGAPAAPTSAAPSAPATSTSPGQNATTTPLATNSTGQSASPTTAAPGQNPQMGPSAAVPQGPVAPGPAATPTNGSTANAATFDLGQTIQMALSASSQLQIANRNLDRDRALVDQAEAGFRPRLDASGEAVYLNKPVKIAFGPEAITVQPISTQTLTAALNLPVDITGQVRAQITVARLTLLSDVYQRDRITNQRILDAETAYFTLLRSEHQVDVAQAALANAQTQYTTTERQFAGGIGQRLDVYRAATQVAQAKQDLLSAQNQLALAQNNLNDIMGRPMDAPIAVPDVPGVNVGINVEQGAIAPGTNPNTLVTPPADLPKLYTPSSGATTSTIDQSVQTAMQNRPELLADQVNIEAAHRQIKIAHAGQEPTLNLGAESNYYPITDFQNPYHSLSMLTATVNIPLYDAGVTRDKVREAKDAEANARSQFSGDQTDVELQVRQAFLNLSTAQQQIDAANTALDQAIIARQLAQVRYANGVGLYLEVTDAQSALISAETNQVNAVYNYLIAQAQLQNATGTPDRNPSL